MVSDSGENRLRRTRYISEIISEKMIGEKILVTGWIEDIRPLGALVFVTIRDSSGLIQTVFNRKNLSTELFEAVKNMPRQSVVAVRGLVKAGKSQAHTVEVQGEEIQVLSEAIHPLPLDPTGRVEASIDKRLDSRALDLRNPKTMAVFKIRHIVLQSIRKTLYEEGFWEVSTAKIIGQAAEGGANLFPFNYFDQKAFLAQSPQLYKEQLTMSLGRVFEIANYYRAEKSHTTRHLNEFTSVDIEAAFAEKDEVMEIAEKMVINAIKDVVKQQPIELEALGQHLKVPKTPFTRVTYSQAVKELNSRGIDINEGDDLKDNDLRILGEIHPEYWWIVDWPAALKPFYIKRTSNGKHALSFDLQHGYLELASGGSRVSDPEELEQRLREAGLPVESFESHLKTFQWGMPPHAGWGFGLDRFIMVVTGVKNIREAILYPRDQFRLTP
jgi:nondiscriminating aspartyl-tRNA synthetase